MMYRLRSYCCAILNGGRFRDLRTIYQGCRALPFALAGLSSLVLGEDLVLVLVIKTSLSRGELYPREREKIWGARSLV